MNEISLLYCQRNGARFLELVLEGYLKDLNSPNQQIINFLCWFSRNSGSKILLLLFDIKHLLSSFISGRVVC